MDAGLCRRLGRALGVHEVSTQERATVARASEDAAGWDDLPAPVRALVVAIERRPLT